MPKRGPRTGSFVLLLIIVGFLAGVVNLFLLRFEAGDSYPAYSSLRSDPLGTKVFFESLQSLEEITAVRNYQRISGIGRYGKATFFLIGTPDFSLNTLPEQELKTFERFVIDGGRLVLLFYPQKQKASPPKQEAAGENKASKGKKGEKETAGKDSDRKNGDPTAQDDAHPRRTGQAEPWNVAISRDESRTAPDGRTMTAVPAGGQGFRLPVSWHSSLWFKGAGSKWRTVYERDGKPVLIERSYGKGSIVLASDSYFVSNEAAMKERNAELLAWLVGGNSFVVFDETHLGIHDTPGVAALIRKYRLHVLFAAFLVPAALFVWKNSSCLVPPRDDSEGSEGARSGKDYLSGFTGLLGRTIPRSEILAVCVMEWKKANRRGAAPDLAPMKAVVEEEDRRPAGERDPVRGYRAIQKLLSERKRTS